MDKDFENLTMQNRLQMQKYNSVGKMHTTDKSDGFVTDYADQLKVTAIVRPRIGSMVGESVKKTLGKINVVPRRFNTPLG
jgi:hypothetical protein